MAAVILNEGKLLLLQYSLGNLNGGSATWKCALYINNLAPAATNVFADFTLATFTGSTPKTLTPASWSSPTIITNRAVSDYDVGTPLNWKNTGSVQTVYGYIVYNTSSIGYWAELFGASRTLNFNEDLDLVLQFRGTTE